MRWCGLLRAAALFGLLAIAAAGAAKADAFPYKPLRLIVPFTPGGPSDISARAIADGLGDVLGQSVVVENKPGAGAIIGVQSLLASPPDGHTLMMGSNVLATGKYLFRKLPFDAMKELRAVIGVSKSPHLVVVRPDFPADTITDLIRIAKDRPGSVNYASAGVGTMPHLGAELFKQVTGVEMVHVPFRGSGPVNSSLMGGHVDVHFDILFSAESLAKSGKLKPIGQTGLVRSEKFPDVPTLDEQGIKGYELYSWFGIVMRSEVPDDVVARLNAAIQQVLDTPAVHERILATGATIVGGPPGVFQAMIEKDDDTWGRAIAKAGITPE